MKVFLDVTKEDVQFGVQPRREFDTFQVIRKVGSFIIACEEVTDDEPDGIPVGHIQLTEDEAVGLAMAILNSR